MWHLLVMPDSCSDLLTLIVSYLLLISCSLILLSGKILILSFNPCIRCFSFFYHNCDYKEFFVFIWYLLYCLLFFSLTNEIILRFRGWLRSFLLLCIVSILISYFLLRVEDTISRRRLSSNIWQSLPFTFESEELKFIGLIRSRMLLFHLGIIECQSW